MAKLKKKDQPTAHGMSPEAMKQRHLNQSNDVEADTVAANGKNANGLRIDKDEAHMVHVQLEVPSFNQSTGARLSKPSVQKFSPKGFEAAKENGAFAGYAVEVLHDPKSPAVDLGEAVEGVRVIDTNYAALQDRYEAATGLKPDTNWTEHQLNEIVLMAEQMKAQFAAQQNAPTPMNQEAAPAHTPPSVATPDAPVMPEGSTAKDVAAVVAEQVANTTPPTGDGNTAVGQLAGRGETEPATATAAATATSAPAAPSGRRGAVPRAAAATAAKPTTTGN